MHKILITGGSGFIGTNLVEHYLQKGHLVCNLDINPPRNPAHIKVWKKLDILDCKRLHKEIEKFVPNKIYHLAARTDMNGNSINDYLVNTTGVSNIINAANESSALIRIIYASSMLVCELGYRPKDNNDYRPNTFYGESKVRGEELVRNSSENNAPWVIVRPTSIWGPWFGVPYKSFFETIKKGLYFHPRNQKITRNYGFVLNTVWQLEALMNCPVELIDSKTLYLADYKPIELGQWADLIQTGFKARKIQDVPVWLLRIYANIGDAIKFVGFSNPPLSTSRLNNMLTCATYDMTSLESICGDLPFSMEEGVKLTTKWLLENK